MVALYTKTKHITRTYKHIYKMLIKRGWGGGGREQQLFSIDWSLRVDNKWCHAKFIIVSNNDKN